MQQENSRGILWLNFHLGKERMRHWSPVSSRFYNPLNKLIPPVQCMSTLVSHWLSCVCPWQGWLLSVIFQNHGKEQGSSCSTAHFLFWLQGSWDCLRVWAIINCFLTSLGFHPVVSNPWTPWISLQNSRICWVKVFECQTRPGSFWLLANEPSSMS